MDTKRQAGFDAVMVIIAIVVLAVLGFIGYKLYSSYNKPAAKTTANSRATDPYAGWKTYCDTIEKACFKYPAGWVLDASSQSGMTNATVKSPNNSAVADYVSSDTRDGTIMPYYTASIDETATASNFRVVGGFLPATAGITPRYKIVDQASTASLAIGQQTSMVNTARFTFEDHTTGHLEAYPINTSFDTDQAKTWFSTDDAKTLLLIEKSFYLE